MKQTKLLKRFRSIRSQMRKLAHEMRRDKEDPRVRAHGQELLGASAIVSEWIDSLEKK